MSASKIKSALTEIEKRADDARLEFYPSLKRQKSSEAVADNPKLVKALRRAMQFVDGATAYNMSRDRTYYDVSSILTEGEQEKDKNLGLPGDV